MKKIKVIVPPKVEYIGNWNDYQLPKGEHCIVDKGVTGCGYTEFCLRNSDNIVLCSPRKLLLENKSDQHVNDKNILYLQNNIKDFTDVDKIKDRIKKHYSDCLFSGKPCKFLITYDSTHYLVETLKSIGALPNFIFIIDEFQSIFGDAFLKSDVELSFVEVLQDCPSVIYLSATPMLDKYLDQMKEFKDLPFYQLDWSNSEYVENMVISKKNVNNLGNEAKKIIKDYLDGHYPMTLDKDNKPVMSTEAVFYFNSVTEIIRIVTSMGLTPDNTRIICSDQKRNKLALRRIGFTIGKIPLKGEKNPMFMFCTSTTYVGVDMYSDNASTYIFSDPNIRCLATDINQELCQIVGRQRNKSNPFKNEVNLIFKTQKKIITREDFDKIQDERRKKTKILIDNYKVLPPEGQKEYVTKLKDGIILNQYSGDFVAISKNTNRPVYNTLIDIANERAWEVSQEDYKCRINVTKALDEAGFYSLGTFATRNDSIVNRFLEDFYSDGIFTHKMKKYCDFRDTHHDSDILESLEYKILDSRFKNYYDYYGTSGCKSRKFQKSNLERDFRNITKEDRFRSKILGYFEIGSKYTKSDIKVKLNEFNDELGITTISKASDLEKYFDLVRTRITVEGKVKEGYKILGYK